MRQLSLKSTIALIFILNGITANAAVLACKHLDRESRQSIEVYISGENKELFLAGDASGIARVILKQGNVKTIYEFHVVSYYSKANSTNIFFAPTKLSPPDFNFHFTRRSTALNDENNFFTLNFNSKVNDIRCHFLKRKS